jgi:cysteinyl-tRNA synthetase, unknown class
MRRTFWGCLVVLVAVGPAAGRTHAEDRPDTALERERARLLEPVKRFGYQLQKLDVAAASRSEADLLVIDPEGDGPRLKSDALARLQRKPSGQPRVILAYLSIGEAEDYRPYWQRAWKTNPPSWLGPVNPDWPGNYEVRFWDPLWQRIILGAPEAPLDRIVAEGYDGVYLDIVDGFEFWEEHGQPDARRRMVDWVRTIANHARDRRPSFLVVPQNGEALADEPGYLSLVDAIGREDLYYDGDHPQDPDEVLEAESDLTLFQKAGKPVFLIEYGKKPQTIRAVTVGAREKGYTPLITVRPLNRLIVSP